MCVCVCVGVFVCVSVCLLCIHASFISDKSNRELNPWALFRKDYPTKKSERALTTLFPFRIEKCLFRSISLICLGK